jgi:uncharacterized membrane protein
MAGPLFWKTLHILAAMWLTVGVFGSAVAFALLKRASDQAGRAFGLRLAWRLMTIYTLPGALLAGALGLYQVMVGGFAFNRGWIHTSLLLWLLLVAAVLFVQVPGLRKALRTGGEVPPLVAIVSHVNALFIVVMVALMTLKPF